MTNRVHDTQYFRTPYLTGSPRELDGGAVVLLIDDKPNSQRPEVIDSSRTCSRSHDLQACAPVLGLGTVHFIASVPFMHLVTVLSRDSNTWKSRMPLLKH